MPGHRRRHAAEVEQHARRTGPAVVHPARRQTGHRAEGVAHVPQQPLTEDRHRASTMECRGRGDCKSVTDNRNTLQRAKRWRQIAHALHYTTPTPAPDTGHKIPISLFGHDTNVAYHPQQSGQRADSNTASPPPPGRRTAGVISSPAGVDGEEQWDVTEVEHVIWMVQHHQMGDGEEKQQSARRRMTQIRPHCQQTLWNRPHCQQTL